MFLEFIAFAILCTVLWDGWWDNEVEAYRSHIFVPRPETGVISRNLKNERVFLNDISPILIDGTSEHPSNGPIFMPSVPFSTASYSIERNSSSLSPNMKSFSSSGTIEIPSQLSSATYGLSKISLTTLWMRLYPSMNYDIGQNSIYKLINLSRKHIGEYIKERLQPADTLEEMILQSVFIGIRFNLTLQNSTVCTESLYLYCVVIHFSSEVELLRLESYTESQIERYRYLLMNYLSAFFDASADAEEAPKNKFLEILQSSDDVYLADTIDMDVTLSDEGYNPFVVQNGPSNRLIMEKKFGDMMKTPMWIFFFTTIFVLVGAICHLIRSYWCAQQASLLKIHIDAAVCALGDIHVEASDVVIEVYHS